jgi:RNA polymerase primary sigma factor
MLLDHPLNRRAIDSIVAECQALSNEPSRSGARAAAATVARIRKGQLQTERARTTLIEANLGLVVWMANKRGGRGLAMADLVQEGNLGIMRAVDKFDHRRGVRFNTYAAWWVRHFMNRALSDQGRVIRLPVHLLETRSKVRRTAQRFSQEHGREPNAEEIAKETGFSLVRVADVLGILPPPLSMDAPAHADGERRLGDQVADQDAASPVDRIAADFVRARLRHVLGTLTAREQEVLRLRFGIDRPEPLNLRQIGERFSLSRERVRQIERDALAKLRAGAETEGLAWHLAS